MAIHERCRAIAEKQTSPQFPAGLFFHMRLLCIASWLDASSLPAAAAFATVAAAVAAIATATTTTAAATTPAAAIAATATAAATAAAPAAATTAAAAATTTPAATATTTAAATAAFFTRLGFVHSEVAAFKGLAVHAVDGSFAASAILELNETKAAGPAGFAVHHQDGADNFTELFKRLTQ
jgi:hypothetical protein